MLSWPVPCCVISDKSSSTSLCIKENWPSWANFHILRFLVLRLWFNSSPKRNIFSPSFWGQSDCFHTVLFDFVLEQLISAPHTEAGVCYLHCSSHSLLHFKLPTPDRDRLRRMRTLGFFFTMVMCVPWKTSGASWKMWQGNMKRFTNVLEASMIKRNSKPGWKCYFPLF